MFLLVNDENSTTRIRILIQNVMNPQKSTCNFRSFYLDCFESVVAEIKSYKLELGGECLLGEEVGGEGVVGQVQQQQAFQALRVTRSV